MCVAGPLICGLCEPTPVGEPGRSPLAVAVTDGFSTLRVQSSGGWKPADFLVFSSYQGPTVIAFMATQ